MPPNMLHLDRFWPSEGVEVAEGLATKNSGEGGHLILFGDFNFPVFHPFAVGGKYVRWTSFSDVFG